MWFLNLYLIKLVFRDLDFVELVLADLSGPNLSFLLDMLFWY